jgi:hypothetical protein
MNHNLQLTTEEAALVADAQFFQTKARIMDKIRGMLEATRKELQDEMAKVVLLTPPGFEPAKCQFVKGEHLEDFPYQYLDYPKHFSGDEMFTFRSLFWWGHHVVFALILEGPLLRQYKKHMVDRFHTIAGRDLTLSLAPTPWEWKCGEGYTLPITHDRKAQIAAVLGERSSVKVARFIPMHDPRLAQGLLHRLGRETFQTVSPIITP